MGRKGEENGREGWMLEVPVKAVLQSTHKEGYTVKRTMLQEVQPPFWLSLLNRPQQQSSSSEKSTSYTMTAAVDSEATTITMTAVAAAAAAAANSSRSKHSHFAPQCLRSRHHAREPAIRPYPPHPSPPLTHQLRKRYVLCSCRLCCCDFELAARA